MKVVREMENMSADLKVRTALCEFEELHGFCPNRITMGCNLVDELAQQFYYLPVSTRGLTAKERAELRCEYEGIPIKIDYDNPDILEVGYMVKWMENKY